MTTYADPAEDYQTIDRLNARIEGLEAALRPFADKFNRLTEEGKRAGRIRIMFPTVSITDLEQAAEALKGTPR